MMGTQKPGGTPNLLRRKFWLLKPGNPRWKPKPDPNPTFATRTHHLSSINLKISFFFFSFFQILSEVQFIEQNRQDLIQSFEK